MSRGLYIGRFQPLHNGHLFAIKWILERENELIIAIGSSQYSHTLRNPFTVGERIEMIWQTLKEENLLDKTIITIVPDTDSRHSLWVSLLLSHVPRFDRAYTNDPITKLLLNEAGIKVRNIPFYKRDLLEATKIRKLIIEGNNIWEQLVPRPVSEYIKRSGCLERLRVLANIYEATQ